MSKQWFKAKNYGWGWTPVSWEGWLVTALYCFFLISWFMGQSPMSRSLVPLLIDYVPRFVFLTAIFIFIAYKKGEAPHFRWGKSKGTNSAK